ncbi:MAG: oligoendopeptidase F, partial [Nitrospinae bacterium RIFCSPLOWO2_12_FULL_47_7]
MDATVELPARDSVPGESQWDLSGLYTTGDKWREDFTFLESAVSGYAGFVGTLSRSAAAIKACLEFDLGISRKVDALYTYAHLKNDEDQTHTSNQENFENVMSLHTRIMEARSFFASELMSVPENRVTVFLQDKELEPYRFHLEQILRFRKHTLSEREESILAASAELARTSQSAFSMLDNADLKLGKVKDELGRETLITHGNYQSLLQNHDRRVRRETFDMYYSAYKDHQYTYASLLSGSIKKDLFYSRTRNYGSSFEKAMFSENLPEAVYDNLIKTVRENLAPLYKYFALRKRILGLEALHTYDTSVPLVKDFQWHMNYSDAVETILTALVPLGESYVASLKKGLTESRWVDRYENKGKRSGAYSSGCYDSNPFILMNYREDNINSIYTLAHEAGHSMQSYYSRKTQPYQYADYTIFAAEVASTFNEALMTRHLLSQNAQRNASPSLPGNNMEIYLVCREIDNIRGTLYRQAMFAEFEYKIHSAAAGNQALTVDSFKTIYRQLLELYFGGGVVLDDNLSLECFRIPHFYSNFYVYKYATGLSAAYA